MCASVPVVAVNDESFRNSVINDLNGYLFNTDEEYMKYIGKLHDDKELKTKLSKQARISSNDFSSDIFAMKVLKVYETAIENYNKEHKKLRTRVKDFIEKRKYKM